MAKSERYKSLKKKSIIFGIISYAALFVTMIVCVVSGCVNFNAVHEGVQVFTDEIKGVFVSMTITAVVGTILTFFLKEGMRTFSWIVCVVLGSIVFGAPGMYTVLSIWLVDDYVIHKLFIHYHDKLKIRREIEYDREDSSREEDSSGS